MFVIMEDWRDIVIREWTTKECWLFWSVFIALVIILILEIKL